MSQKTQLLCLITLNLLPYGKGFGSKNHTFPTNSLFYKTAYFLNSLNLSLVIFAFVLTNRLVSRLGIT